MSEIPPEFNGLDDDLDDDVRTKLNRETSKIPWSELQKFYAKGAVIEVAVGHDLIETAVQISADNKAAVEGWLAEGVISQVNEEQAKQWYEQDVSLWATVIAPWVLVQAINPEAQH